MDIGFIGLGAMGALIVPRLMAAGHAVVGWNRSPDKARPLVAAGMRLAATPRGVAESAEIVFSIVTDAAAAMRPALGGLYRLGGSHAQQDVLEQLYLDSAMKAGLHDDVRLLLERAAGTNPVPPERRIGYAEAARSLAN